MSVAPLSPQLASDPATHCAGPRSGIEREHGKRQRTRKTEARGRATERPGPWAASTQRVHVADWTPLAHSFSGVGAHSLGGLALGQRDHRDGVDE